MKCPNCPRQLESDGDFWKCKPCWLLRPKEIMLNPKDGLTKNLDKLCKEERAKHPMYTLAPGEKPRRTPDLVLTIKGYTFSGYYNGLSMHGEFTIEWDDDIPMVVIDHVTGTQPMFDQEVAYIEDYIQCSGNDLEWAADRDAAAGDALHDSVRDR